MECMIRKAYKQALGLPICTSNERLMALGLHNTVDELREAHTVAQFERLAQTKAGREILKTNGIPYSTQHGKKGDIPRETRDQIRIAPIPRNMHPEYNKARREDRARNLHRKLQHSKDVVYVDAAEYADGKHMTIVATDHDNKEQIGASIKTTKTEVAEEAAIALAIVNTKATVIVSDSKTAIQNYANGRISTEALRILSNFRTRRMVHIIWAPAHSSLPGNEAAHTLARGLTSRAGEELATRITDKDRMITFNDITKHYRMQRAKYPPAHTSLNRQQSTIWRLLQTNTYHSPATLHRYHPDLYTDKCKLCQNRADLDHILWACPKSSKGKFKNKEEWETVLLSSNPDDQLHAIKQAEDAAGIQGLLAAI